MCIKIYTLLHHVMIRAMVGSVKTVGNNVEINKLGSCYHKNNVYIKTLTWGRKWYWVSVRPNLILG